MDVDPDADTVTGNNGKVSHKMRLLMRSHKKEIEFDLEILSQRRQEGRQVVKNESKSNGRRGMSERW